MSLQSSLEGTVIGTVLKNISKSEPVTTTLGFVLACIVAAKVNYGAVLSKDPQAISTLISAIVVAFLGYYTNHGDLQKTLDQETTLVKPSTIDKA